MTKKNEGYYENFKKMREFIESLESINGLEAPTPEARKRKRVPIHDIDAQLIDELLTNWFNFFDGKKIDPVKRDFVIKVFKDLKNMVIYEDFYPYIQAMCEWLRLSSKDPLTGNLALFLLGYCWKNNDKTSKQE